MVGFASPKPVVEGRVTLATMGVFAAHSGFISLTSPGSGPPIAFVAGGVELLPAAPAYGGYGEPSFVFGPRPCPERNPDLGIPPVNSECLTTWGSLKALYLSE